jgi:hypothetical protein
LGSKAKTEMKTSTAELKDFVTHQAAEDVALSPSERSHQEELVADVLSQEAQSDKIRSELLDLYHTETQAA